MPTPCRLRGTLVAGAASLVVASLAGPPARAQDSEPVISSASRYGQSVYEAPASVTVITRDEIRRFGYRTIGEVLSAAGGLFTTYDRNYTYLTVRGLAKRGDFNTRILVLLDGRRLNQPVDDSALLGTEGLVDVEALERVEIIRGPGSTLYGTNAFYAVVNLVTRTGQAASGGEVQVGGGSFDSGYGAMSGGTRTASGLDVFATASAYHTRGPDLLYPEFADHTSDGRAAGLDGDEFARGLVRLMKGDFTLEGFYSTRRKEVPTASYDVVFGDPRTRTHEGGSMLSAGYEHAFADLSRVWASATYQTGFYDGDYPYEEEGLISDYLDSRWFTLESQYQRFVGGRHRVSIGGELRRNLRLEQGVTDALAFRQSSWVAAGFVQGELHFSDRVTLYAGGRYDHYDTFGGSFSPRVVLVTEPVTDTWLKAMYGRAFRAPGAYELFYEDGSVTQKPAVDLEPERLETFEVALERRLRPGLRGSVAVYHTKAKNLIGLVTDPGDELLVYANGDNARSTGLEVALDGHVTGTLLARASYAYQRAKEAPEDLRPVNSPTHLAHLAASLSLARGRLLPGLEVRYLGPRTTLAGDEARSYTLADLTVQLRPSAGSRLELFGKVANVFDTAYFDPGGEEHRQDLLARDGRAFWVSVRFRF